MIHPPRLLGAGEREAFVGHLLALDLHDRHLRFGAAMSDASMRNYANGIDLGRDALFGVFDEGATLVGAAHLARAPSHAEIGLSVASGFRRRGLGSALVAACCRHARACGVRSIFMRCAAENAPMRNLARAHGMRVIVDGPEVDAFLAVPERQAIARHAVLVQH
ncbi:MAG: GNAT family N-acetyltransferase [Burkholderiales bacterium]|nr:GNAT family N-acetyltransferase [Burkholderiales bacterium]